MTPLLLIVAAYLLGAIPTSHLIGRLRGIDLRKQGSGNLGATNAYRVMGWKAATPVFVFDIFKGWLPPFAFPQIDGAAAPEWAIAYGGAAIFGHVFSIYVGFKGGKGVATSSGVLLALAPIAALVSLVVWGALVLITGYVSLASIVAALTVPVVVYLTQGPGPVRWLSLGLATFVVFAHRANMRRLVRGEEHRFRRKAKAAG